MCRINECHVNKVRLSIGVQMDKSDYNIWSLIIPDLVISSS